MAAAHPLVQTIRRMGPSLSVGVLSADLLALGADLARLEAAGVGMAHVDVMDGCYVPMLTAGPPFIKAIRTAMLKDVHLMVREPLASIGDYVAAGADLITLHPDACTHPHRVLQQLGAMKNVRDPERGIARGVALNPGMPVGAIEPILDHAEMVVLVAINPGWGGQKFIDATLRRIDQVQALIAASGRDVLVAVDGGITRQNIGVLAGRGVDLVVTGSAAFDGDVAVNVDQMTRALRG